MADSDFDIFGERRKKQERWPARTPEQRERKILADRERRKHLSADQREGKRQRDRYRRANRTKEQWLKEALAKARRRARACGLAFDLDVSDFWNLPDYCPVFADIRLNYSGGPRNDSTASLERIDNSLGYIRDNVIIVSWRANNTKKDATVPEVIRIGNFYGKGNTANTILHSGPK
jgi:hypothetical protein